jgi:hypothetical protein
LWLDVWRHLGGGGGVSFMLLVGGFWTASLRMHRGCLQHRFWQFNNC